MNHNAAGLIQLKLLTWCSTLSPCPEGSTCVACMHHTPVKYTSVIVYRRSSEMNS